MPVTPVAPEFRSPISLPTCRVHLGRIYEPSESPWRLAADCRSRTGATAGTAPQSGSSSGVVHLLSGVGRVPSRPKSVDHYRLPPGIPLIEALAETLSRQDGLERFEALIRDADWLYCCESACLAPSVVYGEFRCKGRHTQRRGAQITSPCGDCVEA